MNEKDAKLLSDAKWYATKAGFSDLADDFGSYVLLQSLKRKVAIWSLWIDFLRSEFGYDGPLRRKINRFEFDSIQPESVDEIILTDQNPTPLHYLVDRPEFKNDPYISRATLFHAIAILKSKWGFNHQEIAEVFNLHPARISQITKELKSRKRQEA